MNSVKLSHRKRFSAAAIALSLVISLPFSALLIREVAAPTTYEVNITSFAFVPQNLTISLGDSILWNNTDQVIHTLWFVYVANGSTYLLSGPIPPNTTWTHAFNEAVELQYYSFDKLWITGFINVTGDIHDIAVTDVTTSKSGCLGVGNGAAYPVLSQGRTAKVNVTVENQGNNTESFDVTVYANDSVIETYAVINLIPAGQETRTVIWNATGWAKGNYTIKAVADQVPGEIDLADNTFIDKWVIVVCSGDLDNSGIVDITDVVMVTGIYRARIGDPEYNACRDVVEDGVIDISDVVAVTGHYREVC